MEKVLLTGASGFFGKYIYNELKQYFEVVTVSRNAATIKVDLANDVPIMPAVNLVIHCAGKAHFVPKTEKEKQDFFDVNLNGTANLLKGLAHNHNLPKSFVFISSVAVYGCETGSMINEDSPLNAIETYGQSKIQSEQLIQNWCAKYHIICTILRLPLLVGEEPPGNLGAMMNGIRKGYYFNIAGGKARKSMVLAADVANIIPIAAEKGGIFNLTDGSHPTFSELSTVIAKRLGKSKPLNIPLFLAKLIARTGDLLGNNAPINSSKLNKITTDLTFDDSKARKLLNWQPMRVLDFFKPE